ncbi:MAG: hypothetical protein J5637_05490 [Prevotella sp.]|nr:hypothetical protein [Prevotella sp.]
MRRLVIALLCAMLCSSCGDTQNEYTIGACYFVVDNSIHQDATLASAMNVNAPGVFCTITKDIRNGANCFIFSNNTGQNSSSNLNALDSRRTLILGYNNGIIVGFGTLSSPATFYAFDRECPNCFDPQAIPMRSHPLSVNASGMATCATCKRQYNLNNDGFVASGENGKRLTRYRAQTTGPFGVLSVN